ncbi:AraC-like DNA-binding protein [Catenuloplanes nepalensis]|uniref:AraC-like DNA-binding protein n=1 Tax=Catenuloplanes nepalensis TaxID=587533 RepID=A0ABT9MVL0_9ACTN|nr:AraC family transcriptional regulator [Catenuloplanes nepalensis]MDP9795479.1 AraC-like DNA-binding protein [Catenuloplanes nepalensis]
MDPLEDVLRLLGATGRVSAGLIAGGEWAVAFEAPVDVKFNAVRTGACLLLAGGATYELAAGDCFVITRAVPFVLASAVDVAPCRAEGVFRDVAGGFARTGDGDDFVAIGGRFEMHGRAREVLLDGLPPVIHVPARLPEAAAVGAAIAEIDAELRAARAGATLVAEHLALAMLIRVLRLHLATATGWLGGLADPVVAPALRAIHARPAHPWTVAELAGAAAVSRSTLAARFKAVVGRGPLEYLTGWRIELAADRLRRGETVAAIARDVGYGSESALSVAFKRVTGTTPRAYRSFVSGTFR